MGLLDSLNSADGIFALSLLDAAAPKAQRTSFGGGLLSALGNAQQFKSAEEEKRRRAEMQALQMQQIQAQIGEAQAQAQQRQSEAEKMRQAMARQQAFQQALSGATTVSPSQAISQGGPTPANAARIGARQAPDWQALAMQYPDQVDLLKKLAESQNFGAAEVARTIDGRDEQGRPVTTQFDKFGRPVGQGVQQWKAPEKVDTGGQVQFIDPVTLSKLGQLGKTNTPDALLSAQTAMRGQNMSDARAREKNSIDAGAVGKVEWKQDVNGSWIALPKEVSGSGPVTPIGTTAPGKREQQAQNALGIINQAEGLIDKATGSYAGAAIDQGARVFGMAPESAQAAAKLKALEGALMMAQPRMEGPQSDKDVQLYRQMAAQIGDSTVPPAQKKAALEEIKKLHQRYAGGQGNATQTSAQPQIKFLGFE